MNQEEIVFIIIGVLIFLKVAIYTSDLYRWIKKGVTK